MKYSIIVLAALFCFSQNPESCNSCGGGTGDLTVLSLDGFALVNAGVVYDKYLGVWDKDGKWRPYEYNLSQTKILLNGAYRLSKRFQFAISIPLIFNSSSIPGLKTGGSGIGDLTVGGRFELFHEFQPKKKGKKLLLDRSLPYLAVTFGLTAPTGKSEETAENDVDISGKGFFMTSLGISATKSIIKSKFQIIADASWQHSFKKNYKSYYNLPLNSDFIKQPGEKFNYALSLNYIFSSWHSVSLTAAGFVQNSYSINEVEGVNSEERSNSLVLAYTYYPTVPFRITTSFKTGINNDDFGRNAQGSNTFNINFTYYFSDLK